MPLLIKFIALPIYPLGMAVTLGMIGIVLFILRKKVAIWFMIGCFGVLTFFSMPPVAQLLTISLEKPFYSKQLPDTSCAVIVLLGGSGVPMGYPREYPEINEAGDRIIHCARLHKMGYGKKIITTGTAVTDIPKRYPEAIHNALLLSEFGIDSTDIIKELKAKNTHQHAPNIKKILDSLNLQNEIILVTSAAHMKRSILAFKKYGFKIHPAAADFTAGPRLLENVRDLFPVEGALRLSTAALHEYYGIIGYRLLGWI
ncbi:MAG TPA: YdcF family protein [Chitinispirillaceae bacterium]|nr:YdcF family protein [Chitinispirillaceae bacterium]